MPSKPTDHIMNRVEAALDTAPASLSPLTGGCIADVFRIDTPGGDRFVAKHDASAEPKLDREAFMLERLAHAGAPVPAVVYTAPDLLIMTHVDNDGRRSDAGERALARIVAELHGHGAPTFGLDRDTLIGPLDQPNPQTEHWPAFYAEHRLQHFAALAEQRGSLSAGTRSEIDRICARIDELIPNPAPPSLVHGDLWSGNVLWSDGKPAAIIDPAMYHADPEVELAFIDLMGSVGRPFWNAYNERRPIRPGFWETRRDLYAIYPLLVHAALFAGGYGSSVAHKAKRLLS
jgi:fructosamine-3-kinase